MLLLLLICSTTALLNHEEAINFLAQYGYLSAEDVDAERDFEATAVVDGAALGGNDGGGDAFREALKLYQDYFKIVPADGTLNNATVTLMTTRKCGVQDNFENSFTVNPRYYKWNASITHLRWFFESPDCTDTDIAQRAFDIWENHCGLTFERSLRDTNIYISYRGVSHNFRRCCSRLKCHNTFDGKGGILGHAFFPHNTTLQLEIHLDSHEIWSREMSGNPSDRPDEANLFLVLMHEIGHALGIVHTSVEEAIMYPSYQNNYTDIGKFDLHQDDIYAIQTLYPLSLKQPSTTTTTTTRTTAKTSQKPTDDEHPDLCLLTAAGNISTFLNVDADLYIFYKNFVWIKNNLGDAGGTLASPLHINDWLSFSLDNFTRIQSLYMRGRADIIILSNDMIFNLEYPSLVLRYAPVEPDTYFKGLKRSAVIHAIIQNYHGQTLLFYDQVFYIVYDECRQTISRHGSIMYDFPGIPAAVDGAMRYINGYLYFFKSGKFYEFNDFTKSLMRVGDMKLDMFQISCPNISILTQLQALLNQILFRNIKIM